MAVVSVACGVCRSQVEVEKFSMEHTSVQWSTSSRQACEYLSGMTAARDIEALVVGCGALTSAIRAAEADGRFGDLAT